MRRASEILIVEVVIVLIVFVEAVRGLWGRLLVHEAGFIVAVALPRVSDRGRRQLQPGGEQVAGLRGHHGARWRGDVAKVIDSGRGCGETLQIGDQVQQRGVRGIVEP